MSSSSSLAQGSTGQESKLSPRIKFTTGNDGSDRELEINAASTHSRTTSGAISYAESPPITPRSLTFSAVNPFSPPSSVANFSSSPDFTPTSLPGIPQAHYPFPDTTPPRSGVTSVATSFSDLPRMSSYYGSRPTTADYPLANSARTSSARLRETFTSPPPRPLTVFSTALPETSKVQRERPKSTMLASPENLHKPWLETRDPFSRIAYLITYGVMFLGVVAGAFRAWSGWNGVLLMKGNLCVVMDENFDSEDGVFGPNGKFLREVDMSGFGNGEFEMTTASENNSFVQDGFLYITPTLTSDNLGEAAIVDGFVYNITGCTFNVTQGLSYTQSTSNTSAIGADQPFDVEGYVNACSAVSNITTGQVINPVQSARISTRRSASIKYGRVEVKAKLPTGDWMWPAIWMLPRDNVYGAWPLSGEIDIMESRGNGPRYPHQGSNWVRGSLNWGPATWLNAVAKTFGAWTQRRGSFDDGFHTYVLEWTPEYMRIYVDSPLHFMYEMKFKTPFWELGNFPGVVQNGSQTVILPDPWVNGTKTAPFDQEFYLILDVGVGGTNGWFPDGGNKPWLDGSHTAMGDFWKRKDEWYPTWPRSVAQRSMVVDSVKMWQQC